ncbi:hypothetical protein QTP88_017857 [Uroleucon formosanum]
MHLMNCAVLGSKAELRWGRVLLLLMWEDILCRISLSQILEKKGKRLIGLQESGESGDKRIKLSGAAYKKAAKEKLEKTENLLRKIPKLHSYFAATNLEKTESELKKNSPKKIDEIKSCLAGAYEIQNNQIDVQIDNKNPEEATSTNEH